MLTVALHEIGHVLGIGTSSTFESFVNGQEFTGNNTVTLNSYALPLSQDKYHVADNYNENNVLMDPSTTIGDRVQISEIDKAILSDLGYLIDGFLDQASTFDLTTADSETIAGTLLDDLIDALAGNDTIFGNRGDDAIYGGLGDDKSKAEREMIKFLVKVEMIHCSVRRMTTRLMEAKEAIKFKEVRGTTFYMVVTVMIIYMAMMVMIYFWENLDLIRYNLDLATTSS